LSIVNRSNAQTGQMRRAPLTSASFPSLILDGHHKPYLTEYCTYRRTYPGIEYPVFVCISKARGGKGKQSVVEGRPWQEKQREAQDFNAQGQGQGQRQRLKAQGSTAQRLNGSRLVLVSSPLLFHLTASHAPTRFTPPSIAAALHWLAGAMQCHYSRVAVRVWRKTDRQGKCPRQIRTAELRGPGSRMTSRLKVFKLFARSNSRGQPVVAKQVIMLFAV
jgi:hypothetical protein